MKETKGWSPDSNALKIQMHITAIAYNLARVAEESAEAEETEYVHPAVNSYNKELEDRRIEAEKLDRKVNPLHFGKRIRRIASYTIRALQNAIISDLSYATFMRKLQARLVPLWSPQPEH